MRAVLSPLTEVKVPPTSRWPRAAARVLTRPLALCWNLVTTLPVLVLILAMLLTLVPLTRVKFPPM